MCVPVEACEYPRGALLKCRVSFDVDTIRTRLREVAFLNRTATITFETRGAAGSSSNGSGSKGSSSSNGNGTGGHAAAPETFHFSGGIAEFVAWNNRARHAMHEPIFISRVVRNEASMACCASGCFVHQAPAGMLRENY